MTSARMLQRLASMPIRHNLRYRAILFKQPTAISQCLIRCKSTADGAKTTTGWDQAQWGFQTENTINLKINEPAHVETRRRIFLVKQLSAFAFSFIAFNAVLWTLYDFLIRFCLSF